MQIFSGRKKYDSELVSKKIEFDSKTPFSNENWLVCRAQAISCPVMNKIYHGLFFVLLFWEGITLIVFKFWHKIFFFGCYVIKKMWPTLAGIRQSSCWNCLQLRIRRIRSLSYNYHFHSTRCQYVISFALSPFNCSFVFFSKVNILLIYFQHFAFISYGLLYPFSIYTSFLSRYYSQISFFLRDEARGFVKCDNYGSPLHDYWKPFNNISTFEKKFHVLITCRGNKFNLNLLFPQLLYKYAYIKLSIHNTFSFTSEDRRATTNENCKKSVTLWTQQEAASTHAQNGKATAKQSTWTAKWACAVVFADVRQQACLPHATTRNCTQLFLLLVDLVVN